MRKNLSFRISLAVSLLVTVAFAQESAWSSQAYNYNSAGKYLPALVLAERAMGKAKTQEERGQISQELAWYRAYVGDIRGAQNANDTSFGNSSAQPTPINLPDGVQAADAIQSIVKASEGRRIVILNEAHHMPQHRAFALRLALELRKVGFTHLACETFSPFESPQKYPTVQTGYYTLEPVFADFIRKAKQVGFQFVPYEQTTFDNYGDFVDQINRRETTQTKNLMDRVVLKDPKARVFIYVGYDHATENWEKAEDGKRDLAWMAARLARASGIDPLTVDQTEFSEHSRPAFENPMYQAALDRFVSDQPMVFQNATGKPVTFGKYKNKVDMQVLHPRSSSVFGRPDWLSLGSLRSAILIPSELLKVKERVLIQAFRSEEGDDAIPFDQVQVIPKREVPKLMLEPGAYRLRVQDQSGKTRASLSFFFERQQP